MLDSVVVEVNELRKPFKRPKIGYRVIFRMLDNFLATSNYFLAKFH